MIIEYYDPPMCCSTGLCGPSVDENLVKLGENIETIKKKYNGIQVERYMITQQPLKFKENASVFEMVKKEGKSVLPITTLDGEIIKAGEYPTLEELEEKINEQNN
ncbi:MAG: arsenical resistance operon transcriptional repressor ArsD [Firmicutes bacterium HGW-Firmicutes-7]|nr:MAG: arsenical resistance operon transcriptional repressor ArsD [Firmicutes bacterium HGW-Firmicutes-7]